MAYRDMLKRRCRILRSEAIGTPNTPPTSQDDADEFDWGYNENPRIPTAISVTTDATEWMRCWYTDKSGNEVVTFEGVNVRVTTEVDLLTEDARQVLTSDRIELDDGRITDVLNVRILAGGFKAKVQCGSKSGIVAAVATV